MISRQLFGLTAIARALVLLAMAAPILWTRDLPALLALVAIGSIWLVGQLASTRARLARVLDPTVEAALVGVVCGLALESSTAILAALALAPFVAGLRRGLSGVLLAGSAQLVAVVVIALALFDGLSVDESLGTFTWSVAGLGLGFIATFVRATILEAPDDLLPYLHAQGLIRELIDISGGLKSGLDVTSLAGLLMSDVRDELPTTALGLYVPRGEVLVPLVTTGGGGRDLHDAERLAVEAWTRTEPVVEGLTFAFPLGEASVVGGSLSPEAQLPVPEVERLIGLLTGDLRPRAVQLDTALLFSDFRDSATADVRNRLAREMHDGVAQDIASLGYVVDALAARPASEKQAEQFAMLRDRITRIVAEVRQSVLTLRTSLGEAESLGTAIGAVARHLSESSQVPIQVTLDEHATRLRPEVEAELFRITQEAMNNAVKHARCTSIEVHCQVHAPDVLITVTDDGRGLQAGRSDSHGLKIMRERARLVDADLTIADRPAGGLVVTVRITADGRPRATPSTPAVGTTDSTAGGTGSRTPPTAERVAP